MDQSTSQVTASIVHLGLPVDPLNFNHSRGHTPLRGEAGKPEMEQLTRRELSLQRWNASAGPYNTETTVYSLFEQTAAPELAGHVALVFEGEVLSYHELEHRTSCLASQLLLRISLPNLCSIDSVIALCVEKSVEEVAGVVGIMRAAAAYVPLQPNLPESRIKYLLRQSNCAAVLMQRRHELLLSRCAGGRPLVLLEEAACLAESLAQPPGRVHKPVHSSLAYVMFTSGSTGIPKGVLVQHSSLCPFVHHTKTSLLLTAHDSLMLSCSIMFDPSVELVWCTLLCCAQLVIPLANFMQIPVYLHQLCNAHRVTFIDLVPSILAIMLEATNGELPDVRWVYVGGEACPPKLPNVVLASNPHLQIANMYGPTEATVTSHMHVCQLTDGINSVPIGAALTNTQCSVVSDGCGLCPHGVPGELWLCGPKLARGEQKF